MKRIRVTVCDDEAVARNIVASSFQAVFAQHGVETEITACATVSELVQKQMVSASDLLILDIDMPGMSGVAFGKQLRQQKNEIDIIYVSNREDKVFDSLKVNPVGFVRKSHLLEDIPDVVEHYLHDQEKTSSARKLVVETKEKIISIPLKSILYFEGARNCQLIHIQGQTEPLPIRRNLQELEEELSGDGFLRIHKGYLVNFDYIRLIEETDVQLTNGERVPMSRRKVQETKARFLKLMQNSGVFLP